jgi:hypothetical protein
VRSKTQILKTASTLKDFSTKIKSAQEEVLTPETVREIAQEILEVAEVASELAEEIAEGVPAEQERGLGERGERDEMGEEEEETRQIEVAAEETEEEKKKRLEAVDDKEDDKDKLKEKVATLSGELLEIKREAKLAKLAPKYASLFPQSMHDAKLNEILNSKQPLNIVEAKVQEASDIITNKTMVKVASMSDSIYDFTDTSEEVNIASYL